MVLGTDSRSTIRDSNLLTETILFCRTARLTFLCYPCRCSPLFRILPKRRVGAAVTQVNSLLSCFLASSKPRGQSIQRTQMTLLYFLKSSFGGHIRFSSNCRIGSGSPHIFSPSSLPHPRRQYSSRFLSFRTRSMSTSPTLPTQANLDPAEYTSSSSSSSSSSHSSLLAYPCPTILTNALRLVRDSPNKVAIVEIRDHPTDFQERYVTYGDLWTKVVDLMTVLHQVLRIQSRNHEESDREGQPFDSEQPRIAVRVHPGPAYVVAQWAVWGVGAIFVPLHIQSTAKEIQYVMEDAQLALILLGSCTAIDGEKDEDRVRSLFATNKQNSHTKSNPMILFLDQDSLKVSAPSQSLEATSRPTDAVSSLHTLVNHHAMILYTSGTTGQPKGVLWTHDMLTYQFHTLSKAWHWSSQDKILNVLPLHHVHGIVNIVGCALYNGGTLQMMQRFSPVAVWKWLMRKETTVFMAVPTIYARLITFYQDQDQDQDQDHKSIQDHDHNQASALDVSGSLLPVPVHAGTSWTSQASEVIRTMRLCVCGSAPLQELHFQKWAQISAGQLLLERYGMTEIGMAISNPYALDRRRKGWVGQLLPGVGAKILKDDATVVYVQSKEEFDVEDTAKHDVDGVNSLRVNVIGELLVKGPGVFTTYWRREKATAESFDAEGYFFTGDVVEYEPASGFFRIMGRKSMDIIKSGGYKLSALEIEHHIMDHPLVKEVAVVGIPDDDMGQLVGAALVVSPKGWNTNDFTQWCSTIMSKYKIPRRHIFVDELPRNAMGKVQKQRLLEIFAGS